MEHKTTAEASPGLLKYEEWQKAQRRVSQMRGELEDAQDEVDRIYREMARLGRREGWHV